MNKIKVALVGYGYWGPNLLRNLFKHPLIRVEYVCDLSLAHLKKAKTEYPGVAVTQDLKKVLEDPFITCIVIAVPTVQHFKIARECILAGKNVLIEKPMTVTVKESQDLVRLARQKGTAICVDHPYIFSEPIKKIKSLIDKGKLGKLYYYNSIRANLGRIDKSTNVFFDLAPHDLAILDYLLDKEEPKEVHIKGSCHVFNLPNYIESGSLFLKYKSGFAASIHLNWLSPVKMRHITIAGDKRMLLNDDTHPNRLQVFNSRINVLQPDKNTLKIKYKYGQPLAFKIKDTEPLYEVIDSLVQAILYKKSVPNDGSMGLRIVKTLEKINAII